MGDPSTAASASMGGTVLSGIWSGISDLWKGAQEGKMYEFQAGIARQQAETEAVKQRMMFATGEDRALMQGRSWQQRTMAQIAHYGAGNINPFSGTAAMARASLTEAAQRSGAAERTTAARDIYGSQIKEAADYAMVQQYSTASATAREASYLSAAGDVLKAGGQVAGQWYQYQSAFGPGSPGAPPGPQWGDPSNP